LCKIFTDAEKENVIQRITSKLNLAVQEKGCETEEKTKLSLRVLKQYATKRHEGVELWLHAFLTWALYKEKWSSTHSGSFSTGHPMVRRLGGWVATIWDKIRICTPRESNSDSLVVRNGT